MTVRTPNGCRVFARRAVIAAGFETGAKAARRVVKLKSSYALVTRPVPAFSGWPGRCLIWETARPYFYLRTTCDNRILTGGADEDFANPGKRDRLVGQKATVLHDTIRQMFPHIHTRPSRSWAGTFGETKDGLPYIRRVETGSRILYAHCYGANGTNFAVIAAAILRDIILEKRNPDFRLFRFDR